jgi:hypothetical protein
MGSLGRWRPGPIKPTSRSIFTGRLHRFAIAAVNAEAAERPVRLEPAGRRVLKRTGRYSSVASRRHGGGQRGRGSAAEAEAEERAGGSAGNQCVPGPGATHFVSDPIQAARDWTGNGSA